MSFDDERPPWEQQPVLREQEPHPRADTPPAKQPELRVIQGGAKSLEPFECGHERSTVMPFQKKCPTCEGKRNREHVERLREVIQEAKRLLASGTDPETERVLIHRLRVLAHPEPEGLVQYLNAKRRENEDGGGHARRHR